MNADKMEHMHDCDSCSRMEELECEKDDLENEVIRLKSLIMDMVECALNADEISRLEAVRDE